MKTEKTYLPAEKPGSFVFADRMIFNNDALVDMKYITLLTKMTDKWIYAQIQKGHFPKPLKLGRSSRWKYSEIRDWLGKVEHAREL